MPQAAFLEQGGCFSNDDGEDSENVKKANNNFAPASHFFVYISLRSLQDWDVKMPVLRFLEDVNKRRRTNISFSY